MNHNIIPVVPKSTNHAGAHATSLPLDIQLIVLDETGYYSNEVTHLAGKIFQVYAYDANRVTYCCEITPSYDLHPVSTQALNCPDSESEREKLDSMLRAQSTESQYRHCAAVDTLPGKYRRAYHAFDRDFEESYDVQLESVLESVRCNPPCVVPGRTDCIIV